MSDTCPTVKITATDAAQGDFVLINAADFDEKVHKPYAEEPGGLTKPEIMADLDRLGIEYDARWSRDKLDALLREGKPAREAAINALAEGE